MTAVPVEENVRAIPKPGVVASTCAVLRFLAQTEHPVGVNAIARELAMAPSSCFKILKALQVENFVDFDERSKAYTLGYGVTALSRRALDPTHAYSALRDRLEALAHEQSIAIGFWRLLPNKRIVLTGFAEGGTQMRIHMTLGQRLPRLVGAVGRAIAADLDLTDDQIEQEFKMLQWQSNLGFEDYLAEVARARKSGYALDIGDFAPGICTAAATIKDDAGLVHFGLSGIMFNGQHDDAAIQRIGTLLVELAKTCSLRLGLRRAF